MSGGSGQGEGTTPCINVWLHDDHPCPCTDELQYLGAEATAQVVASLVKTNTGPLSIGVFGTWGSGKTTVLDRVEEVCKNDMPVVRLNPWEHEREVDPLASLTIELIDELGRLKTVPQFSWLEQAYIALNGWRDKVLQLKWARAAAILSGATLEATGHPEGKFLVTGAGLAPKPEELGEAPPPPTYRSVRKQLEEAVEENKVLVCLDDLDRCRPERALAVLEAMKHLLWAKGFVFVIALDPVVLTKYLDAVHEKESGIKEPGIGERYLEKLVQAKVPVVHRDTKLFDSYVANIVDHALSQNEAWLPSAEDLGAVPALLSAAAARQPRQAKRLVNSVVIDWALAHQGGMDE